jgi:RNA polymerase sigma factor (sigma-70 family)
VEFETDAELVAGLLRRKVEAWECFIESYRSMIFGIIRRRAYVGVDEYEEIYAEILAKICANEFKVLRHWAGRGKLKGFLAISIANFVRDLNRARSRSPRESGLDECRDSDLPSHQSLEADEDERRAVSCYRECVGKLTDKQRKVLELHAAGYTYKQIAEELQITEEYVGVRLTEIRKRLRELLLERCPDSVETLWRAASAKRERPRVKI